MTSQPKGRLVWVPDGAECRIYRRQEGAWGILVRQPIKPPTAADIDALVTDEVLEKALAPIGKYARWDLIDCGFERALKAALRELLGVKP